MPPTRGKEILAVIIPSLTSHFLHCSKLTHTLEKLIISSSPKLSLVGALNLLNPSARMHSVFILFHALPAYLCLQLGI
jgi:hypothetical protein